MAAFGGRQHQWTPRGRAFAFANIGQLSRLAVISRASAWTFLLRVAKMHPDLVVPTQTQTFLSTNTKALNAQLAEDALSGLVDLRPFNAAETATLRALQQRAQSEQLKFLFLHHLFEKTG